MADGNRIKLAIEAEFARQLGDRDLARLKDILTRLTEAGGSDTAPPAQD